jgi:hypothetical protein
MMIFEPKCVLWKRLGAEKVQRQIEGLTLSEELEFWQNQTASLKAAQQKIRKKLSNNSIQPIPTTLRSAAS